MTKANAPEGYSTINPFIITKDASALITFLESVFDASEVKEAHTLDDDGLLLHSELKIGDATVMIADRKKDWPYTPSLLQVYVDDVELTLAKAEKLGARIVTKPTDFYGDTLSRMIDPWNNLWWIYQHSDQEVSWDESAADSDSSDWSAAPTKELTYIHDTLLTAMKKLKE